MAEKDKYYDGGNLLAVLMSQAHDFDFSDPDSSDSNKKQDPGRLMVDGFEVSRLFTVIDFALLHAKDEEGVLAGLGMIDREEAVKSVRAVLLFIVTNAKNDKQEFLVDMRKTGSFYLGTGPLKTKPDVIIWVSDKDLVDLSTGKINPQATLMKGRIKGRGNLMLGLRVCVKGESFGISLAHTAFHSLAYPCPSSSQAMLQREVTKMSRL